MLLHCHLSEFWSIKQWHGLSPFLKHKDCQPFLLYPTTTWYMTWCYTNWLQQYRLKRSPGCRQLWGSDVASFFLLDSELAHSLLSACVNNAPELPEQKLSQGEWNHPAGVRDASSDQDLLRISPPTYCCRPTNWTQIPGGVAECSPFAPPGCFAASLLSGAISIGLPNTTVFTH